MRKYMNLGIFYDREDFTAGQGGGAAETNPPVEPKPQEQPVEPKTYTQEEVDALVKLEAQKEADRVRTKAAKEKRQLELDKLSAEDRLKAEQADFQAEKEEYQRKQLIDFAGETLVNEELPFHYREMLVGKDQESTKSKIEAFKTQYNADIQKAAEAIVKGQGNIPTTGSGVGGKGLTADEISKLSDEQYFKMRAEGKI